MMDEPTTTQRLQYAILILQEKELTKFEIDELKEIAHELKLLANRKEKELLAGKTKEERLNL